MGIAPTVIALQRLMNGEKADLGFTSPPYNSGGADFTYDYKAKKQVDFTQMIKMIKQKTNTWNFAFLY